MTLLITIDQFTVIRSFVALFLEFTFLTPLGKKPPAASITAVVVIIAVRDPMTRENRISPANNQKMANALPWTEAGVRSP